MGGEWREGPLGEVIELKRGYDLPQKDRIRGSVPIVSSSGISDYHIESKVTGPGVVTGRYGTIGQVFFIDCDFWPLNTTLYVRDFKGNDPLFISYFLRTLDFQAYSDKAAVPGVNRNHLHQARVRFPLLPEQKAIALILSSLDDKIELNRRMNATLEQMAQALFRAWFVDFEPVKAKAAGLQPASMDAQTAALFPSELVESELGLIPKGWEVGALDDVCTSRRNNVHPSTVSSDTPYVGLEHVPQKSIALTSWGMAADVDSTKARFCSGDILFGKLRPYFHKVVVAPVDGICSTDILVLQSKASGDFAFLLGHVSGSELIEYATRVSNGARMPRVGWKDVAVYPIVLPPQEIREKYNEMIEEFVAMIQANIFEVQTLTELRDTLLPRLISGRLRVPEAEKIISET